MALAVLDFTFIGATLLLTGLIGIYFSRTQNNFLEFVLASRGMSLIPVCLSFLSTTFSAVTMLGVVGEVYLYGTQYIILAVTETVVKLISANWIVPVFHSMQYITVYEYVERRFDRLTRVVFSSIYLIGNMFYVGVVLYTPALALTTLTGLPQWATTIGSGLLCIFYSSIGGYRAVVWTDVIQALLMCSCFILITVVGIHRIGGIEQVWDRAVEGERIGHFTLTEDSFTRYSVWSLIAAGIFLTLKKFCVDQACLQRLLSVKGLKEAKRTTQITAAEFLLFYSIVAVSATVIYANFQDCDPLLTVNSVKSPDQLLPYAISQFLAGFPGLQGIAVSGIISGSLSTFSSYINSFATIVLADFILPHFPNLKKKEKRCVWICKFMTFVFGILCLGISFLVPKLGGIIKVFNSILGATNGPLVGVMCLGIFFRKANTKGSKLGLVVGLALCLFVAFGSQKTAKYRTLPLSADNCFDNSSTIYVNFNLTSSTETNSEDAWVLPRISFMWLGAIGVVTTFIFGAVVSLLTGGDNGEPIDERLLSPLMRSSNRTQSRQARNGNVVKVSAENSFQMETLLEQSQRLPKTQTNVINV